MEKQTLEINTNQQTEEITLNEFLENAVKVKKWLLIFEKERKKDIATHLESDLLELDDFLTKLWVSYSTRQRAITILEHKLEAVGNSAGIR